MPENTNDNDADFRAGAAPGMDVGAPEPDAHGQAAMLLIESLIFALVERSVISVADAVEIVEVAAEVKTEMAVDIGEAPATLRRSLGLLTAISDSLKLDTKGD